MNYFLLLIIFALCGGAYYEYANLKTESAADVQEVKLHLEGQIDQLEADHKALEDTNKQLTQAEAADKTQVTVLTAQVQAAQKALEDATKALQLALMPKPAPPAPAPPVNTNNLGAIATLDGKNFAASQLLKVDTTGITINSSAGITKLAFVLLPPPLQKRFGFDPAQGTELTEAQAQFAEQQRQAAAGK